MQISRPRRLRMNASIRDLVRETQLSASDLIAPLFVIEGSDKKIEIKTMPGQYRLSSDLILKKAKDLYALGVKGVALFPALDDSLKTPTAKEALNEDGLYIETIKKLKQQIPDLLIMSDVALDPYSSDGHDGLVDSQTGEILNDATLEILTQMSVLQAKAGCDIIGPSDMMDGRVGKMRKALEAEGFHSTLIMSYTAKYASSFYGPFRDALDSAPKAGDKKTYQMDWGNAKEAMRELKLDEEEGADIVMVKPALSYLDVIYRLKQASSLPVAAYNVSGEYAMIKNAHQQGLCDEKLARLEILTSMKRAGADIILTYFAEEMARDLGGY